MINSLFLQSPAMQNRKLISTLGALLFFFFVQSQAVFAAGDVGLYDVFETQVVNTKTYSNPFDFNVIELQASFTSPTGKNYAFFGFHDGDGVGGQTGTVWRLRFMPDEVGSWSYTYSWTDGSTGGSGNFNVTDTGLPGPLKMASDNTWYFETARGDVFDARGYTLHQYLEGKYGRSVFTQAAIDDFKNKLNTKVADRNYNLLMTLWPMQTDDADNHWWFHPGSGPDFSRFDVTVWERIEQLLVLGQSREIYLFPFAGLIDQVSARPNNSELDLFLRYYAARLGPYWNHFGHSITWEYQDILNNSEANDIMTTLSNHLDNLPIPPMLSVHDHSNNSFTGWLGFSMRQLQSRSVFDGNLHGGGQQGGVGSAFTSMPIIGSEDIWETQGGATGQPRNATEIRRGAWGLMMAGVMPIYNETGLTDSRAPAGGRSNFSGDGESEVRRMFDFFYVKTRYRQYQQLNGLVASVSRQIASGIPGEEYLVYDEDGGSISIDLSGTSNTFSVLWFDPTSGTEQNGGNITGGGASTLNSPFSGDSVLLLMNAPSDTSPPSTPIGVVGTAISTTRIDLTWDAASDSESGISFYRIYRDGALVNPSSTTSFSDTELNAASTYAYEVSAVNGAGLEGSKSSAISATSLGDATPPQMVSATASAEGNSLVVVFDEAIELISATSPGNYDINNGVTISAAALGTDLKTVTLATSMHSENILYSLTVNNITDRATTPNIIASNSQITYTFSGQLLLSNLSVTSGETYEIIQDGLTDGVLVYIDRSFLYGSVTPVFDGATYFKTANNDKSETASSFLSFDVNQAVSVYIAHDDRITSKPTWLNAYTDTGQNVVINNQTHSLLREDFVLGTITLGGNGGEGSSSMYGITVFRQGDAPIIDNTPPANPNGLNAQ